MVGGESLKFTPPAPAAQYMCQLLKRIMYKGSENTNKGNSERDVKENGPRKTM